MFPNPTALRRRTASRTRTAAAVVAILAAFAVPAHAQTIVVESYGTARPADAGKLLPTLYDELGSRDYETDAKALILRVEARISRAGESIADARVDAVVERVDRAYQAWLDASFDTAIAKATAALEPLQARPATVAIHPRARDAQFKALIALSLARSRAGDATGASSAMAELVRSFPDRDISRAEYGPEPRSLYMKVKQELDEQTPGRLRIRPDDPTVVVFVNGRYLGVGEVDLDPVIPGTYRVFVRRGDQSGRVHDVEVAPGSESTLSIAWNFEASLKARGSFVGFVFPDEGARQREESSHATSLARRLGAKGVVVVGIRPFRGRRSIVGTVLDLDSGKPVRSGAVALEPALASEDDVRALARFLAGGSAAPGVVMVGTETPRDRASSSRSRWPWLVVGAGVVALAGGATLLAIDESPVEDGAQQKSHRETRNAGLVTVSAGAVLVGAGLYLWWRGRGDSDSTERDIALTPATGDVWGLAVSGRF